MTSWKPLVRLAFGVLLLKMTIHGIVIVVGILMSSVLIRKDVTRARTLFYWFVLRSEFSNCLYTAVKFPLTFQLSVAVLAALCNSVTVQCLPSNNTDTCRTNHSTCLQMFLARWPVSLRSSTAVATGSHCRGRNRRSVEELLLSPTAWRHGPSEEKAGLDGSRFVSKRTSAY